MIPAIGTALIYSWQGALVVIVFLAVVYFAYKHVKG
jgi:cbb3-type cytochrome oxidase subunit 3